MFGAHYVGDNLKTKIISSNGAHGNGHTTFYEGDHRYDHFICFPFVKPLPLCSVSHAHMWWNVIFGPETPHTFLGVYQMLKSTHFLRNLQGKFCKEGIKVKESSGRLIGVRNGLRTKFLYL